MEGMESVEDLRIQFLTSNPHEGEKVSAMFTAWRKKQMKQQEQWLKDKSSAFGPCALGKDNLVKCKYSMTWVRYLNENMEEFHELS